MYHIPGMTPEAPTLEAAFQGKKPKETIVITRSDLKRVYDMMNYGSSRDIDFVYLGCPHYTIEEIKKAANLLLGKKCSPNTTLWIMTNPPTYKMADMAGYRKTIEDAGGLLFPAPAPACLMAKAWCRRRCPESHGHGCLQAGLLYYRVCHKEKTQVRYGTMEECVNAAVTGKWQGEWR